MEVMRGLVNYQSYNVISLVTHADILGIFKFQVLVVWQVSTGYKSFLPRLGGPISSITSNSRDARLVVSTLDNGVHCLNTASMRRSWERRAVYIGKGELGSGAILGRGIFHSDRELQFMAIESPRGITGGSSVFCNGAPGQLQRLSVPDSDSSSRFIDSGRAASVQITGFIHVSGKGDPDDRVFVPSVTLFRFSAELDGGRHLLATVDVQSLVAEEPPTMPSRRSSACSLKVSLKIWILDGDIDGTEFTSEESSCRYRLVAQVDRPHALATVSRMEWMPRPMHLSAPWLASAANDGTVKLWSSSEDGFKSVAVTSIICTSSVINAYMSTETPCHPV